MKTELCGPLRPPHRPAACCWSSIPAPDRRRMSPDRKHRQSHRRRPCRTHCPDRKAWAAFPPPSAPKGRRQCPNRSGPCRRDCLPAPPKGPRRYPRPQQAPPTWKCSPPCGPGKSARRLYRAGCRQAAARRALRSLSRSLPLAGFLLRLRCLHGDLLPLAGHVLDLLPRRFGRRLLRRCLHIGSRQVPVAQTGFGRPEIDQQPFAGKQLVPPHIERHEQESRRDRQRIKQSCEARPTTRVRFIVIRIVIIHRSILTRKTPQGGIPRVSLYSGEVAAMSVKLLALAMRIMATTSSKATDLSQCSETVGFSCPASRDLRAFSTPSREPTFSVST